MSQTFFSKPPGGLYSLPYLSEGLQTEPAALSRAEWWEILFFIKKLEPKQHQEVNSILQQSLDDQVRNTLIKEHAGKLMLSSDDIQSLNQNTGTSETSVCST